MWTDQEWFIYRLEVQIWFWSSAAWPLNFLYLSFSTFYSSSLRRTHTIVFSKLNKHPPQTHPPTPSNGLEINKPPLPLGGLIEDLQHWGLKLEMWVLKQHTFLSGRYLHAKATLSSISIPSSASKKKHHSFRNNIIHCILNNYSLRFLWYPDIKVGVISLSLRLTLTETLIILDITKTESIVSL